MTSRIAVVDDDQNILTSVGIALEAEGYAISTYTDGEQALKGLVDEPADLAVLDIKMPRMDGLEMLTRLRRESRIPVIFLTSKDDEVDELVGLEVGADDYITKPFSMRLLIQRIRTLLRRVELVRGEDESDTDLEQTVLSRGELMLDAARHLCTWKGKSVALTVTEFLILQALATRLGHVKNRDQLMDVAYGDNVYVSDRTIDSHIKRMRKKFRNIDTNFGHIETLYGVGYRYSED